MLPEEKLALLEEMHQGTGGGVTGPVYCCYDGFTWPCPERRVLDGDRSRPAEIDWSPPVQEGFEVAPGSITVRAW